ncbi:reverse transcriptase domain-containing protein [Tanacetum coccineum]
MADFLNEVPVGTKHLEVCSLTNDENSKELTLFTDGASNLKGAGVGLVLIDPAGTEYTYVIRLKFTSTNSEVEYEALLASLRIAGKMKVLALKVKVDSKLVACQLNGKFVVSSDGMAKYLAKAKELSALFKKFSIGNVLNTKSVEAREMNAIVEEEEEEDNWMTPIIKFLKEGIWPKDENKVRALWMKISQGMQNACRGTVRGCKDNEARILLVVHAQGHQRGCGQWGLDIPGPLPEGPRRLKFIIVAIDYFTKWMEAKPLAKITGKEAKKFVWENILCMFGLPRERSRDPSRDRHANLLNHSLERGTKQRGDAVKLGSHPRKEGDNSNPRSQIQKESGTIL